MQLWRVRFTRGQLRQRCAEEAVLEKQVEQTCRYDLRALIRPRQPVAELRRQRIWPQVIELTRVRADVFLRYQSDFDEALAVLFAAVQV